MRTLRHYKDINSTIREDASHIDDQLIILLDGASGLGKSNMNRSSRFKSDARWYSTKFCQLLPRYYHENNDMKSALTKTMTQLKNEYLKHSIKKNPDKHLLPSATGTIVELKDNKVNFYCLGDIKTLVKLKNSSVIKIQDDRLEKLDNRIFNLAESNSNNSTSFKEEISKLRSEIIHNRSLMNTDEGYYIFSFDLSALDHMYTQSFSLDDIDEIIMMSDGFYSVFTAEDQSLFEELKTFKKKSDLTFHIRGILTRDPEFNNYQRFKLVDDMSMIHIKND